MTPQPDNTIRTRAKDQLPTVLLTLLSIVQAIALELLWEHITSTQTLYQLSFATTLSWLQIAATLFGILLIWLTYSSLTMRFRWTPSTTDSLFPFLVGLVEFTLIETLGPATVGPWLVTLGVMFALMTWISQHTMVRARQDIENDEFFSKTPRATVRDFYTIIGAVGLFFVGGAAVWTRSDQGWLALVLVMTSTGAILYQTWQNNYYWENSLRR